MNDLEHVAVIGIAMVASEALLAQQVGAYTGGVPEIRRMVEASSYWTEFRRLVASDLVARNFVSIPALAECVLAWARDSAEVPA